MLVALLPFGMFICGVAMLGQAPVVDIEIHKNRNLWKAQRNIAIAYDCIDEALRTKPRDAGEHAKKAQDLLRKASIELTLAANANR